MYEIFMQLCKEHCVTSYRVSKETGISQAALSTWKKGDSVPRDSTLKKIADFFGVSVAFLKGETTDRMPYSIPMDEELESYLDMLRNRSECRMLFSLAKDATPKDVERAVAIIEALRRTDGRGE